MCGGGPREPGKRQRFSYTWRRQTRCSSQRHPKALYPTTQDIKISIMRLMLLMLLFTLICVPNAGGIMYLFSGTDSYGQGLSYPGIHNSPAIASFVIKDNTSRLASVFLGATIMRPEFRQIKYHNHSENYPLVESFRNNSLWSQYSFYLPTITPKRLGSCEPYMVFSRKRGSGPRHKGFRAVRLGACQRGLRDAGHSRVHARRSVPHGCRGA